MAVRPAKRETTLAKRAGMDSGDAVAFNELVISVSLGNEHGEIRLHLRRVMFHPRIFFFEQQLVAVLVVERGFFDTRRNRLIGFMSARPPLMQGPVP